MHRKVFQVLAKIKNLKFTGISDDSRSVKKGDVFFAMHGARLDGSKFIAEAVARGASCIVTGRGFKGKVSGCLLIKVADPRMALAKLACAFYGRPSKKIKVIGITGTNGKTTISYILRDIFTACGKQMGIIGTIAHCWKDKTIEAKNTTPGVLELQGLLAAMQRASVEYCAMEVSSHSIDQDRISGVDFRAAVFTNISGEHLDYHKTMKNYIATKAKLFKGLKASSRAIVNVDDKNWRRMKQGIKAQVVTYGIKNKAWIRAENIRLGIKNTEFVVKTPDRSFSVSSPLIGIFNVYNILAAAACALKEDIPPEIIRAAVSGFRGAEGRLQAAGTRQGPAIFVDYAHTDDALKNVLCALREVSAKRIILVFGCGGDRDTLKRPRMGNIASNLADYVIITSDNPRSEDPFIIAKEIEKGIRKNFTDYKIVLDRFSAIAEAIRMASANDVILIAGKGHEKYQIIGKKALPFSDKEAVREILKSGYS